MFGVFILLVLVGTTNAVNITDGLDGLCGGLSVMAFLAFGVMAWGTTWLTGNEELAIFSFVLVGSLMGFLVFNAHPAKIFMGDTGSLALGGALATIAILTRHELSLVLIGGVFVIETLSSLIQIIAIRKYNKKVFLKAPLHHHFEEMGWIETDIVRLFWVVGLLLAMLGIIYGVWL
jgi:phospho-N-acetylmuramoyl-pentapeptide-transferase